MNLNWLRRKRNPHWLKLTFLKTLLVRISPRYKLPLVRYLFMPQRMMTSPTTSKCPKACHRRTKCSPVKREEKKGWVGPIPLGTASLLVAHLDSYAATRSTLTPRHEGSQLQRRRNNAQVHRGKLFPHEVAAVLCTQRNGGRTAMQERPNAGTPGKSRHGSWHWSLSLSLFFDKSEMVWQEGRFLLIIGASPDRIADFLMCYKRFMSEETLSSLWLTLCKEVLREEKRRNLRTTAFLLER